jgi:chaperone required for assembly of F1-ATPase
MKRFYAEAGVAAASGGQAILLDGRGIKTPERAPLIVPTLALAEAIAAEWAAQGEEIRPGEMPLTGLANAAIDVIAPAIATICEQIGAYAETDALAYRGDDSALLARQIAEWNPILAWAEVEWGIQFTLASGIMHVDQPPETVAALRQAVGHYDAWHLAALSPLTTIGGSLVVALGVVTGIINPDHGWAAVTLEESFQAERWGEDADATAARAAREREWQAAARFAALLGR